MHSVEGIKRIIPPLAGRFGFGRMRLFGSYAHGEATPDGDTDFRIDRGEIRGLSMLGGFCRELEEALGARIDLLATGALSDEFLGRIPEDGIVVYGGVA
jgi:predicted nucleotidyltransferase